MQVETIVSPEQIVATKICSRCEEPKLLNEFSPHKRGGAGRQAACRECENKRNREYHRTHPEGSKERHRRSRQRNKERYKQDQIYREKCQSYERNTRIKRGYNLTQKEYLNLLESQQNVCAICGNPETAHNQYGPISLAVDHDHATGRVRGLLCVRCNVKIGILEDKDFVTLACAYLDFHKEAQSS